MDNSQKQVNLDNLDKKNTQNLSMNTCNNLSLVSECEIKLKFFEAIVECNSNEVKKFLKNQNCKIWEWTENDGYTALHRSTFMDLTLIIQLIFEELNNRGIEKSVIKQWINMESVQGFRCIHFASYRGNIDVIKMLIDYGADYTVSNEKGLNVLHMAAQGDNPSSLIYFLEKFNMNLDSKDVVGSTPLHWACFTGSENAFNFIINYNSRQYVDVNCQDKQGLTPMHLAVMSGKIYILNSI